MAARHRVRTLITLLAAVFALSIGVLSAVPASAAPVDVAGSNAVPLQLSTATAPGPKTAVTAAAAVSDTCPTVRAQLHRYAALGMRRVSCTTVTRVPTKASATSRVAGPLAAKSSVTGSTVAPAAASYCSQSDGTTWIYTRFEGCVQGSSITETIFDPETGDIIGTALWLVNQDLILQPTSPTFTENDTVQWLEATGYADNPRTMTFTGQCGSACTTLYGGTYTGPIALGDTVNFAFAYEDPTATQDTFSIDYSFNVSSPPLVLPSAPATWPLPLNIRCDNQINGQGAGCVFPTGYSYTFLSLSTYGAGAAHVLIGENFLPGQPGTMASPLTRLADQTQRDANYNAICGDGTWLPSTLVTNDSCDEYAFASTYQSGGAIGLTGSDCAEGIPFQANGNWMVSWVSYTGTEQCLRDHVPLDQNSAVGGALGVFYKNYRVLDGDPFFIFVTD